MPRVEMELPDRIKKAVLMYHPIDGFFSTGQEKIMQPVIIRPVGDEYGNKTYLGFFLGNYILEINLLDGKRMLPTGDETEESREKELIVLASNNPAIFVPEFGKVIWGAESWWGFIEDEKDLRQITDADIQNIWYVRALKMLNREK